MQAQAALELAPDLEERYEIVNGQPEEKEKPGGLHGVVAMCLAIEVGGFIKAHKLGEASTEANFKIGAGERIPDLSFVSATRIPAEGIPSGVWQIPPDLAIEIISPNDLHEKVSKKVLEYLDAGVKQVWLVSLESEAITIYRSFNDSRVLRGSETELTSEDLLPGFCCKLAELFPASAVM
jgi:Uma2 family endonuclease